ncbi:PstA3 [Desulforapulum autotrophicum HRM2]|uniref:PstA3 n=1 Tax=Desulforapulum autotrophicum (strain ATCC 43914 / DSM 3382 / VKM B-1955 / HRM2) TaxID=177437 RepID=C0QJC7_DESAH|nr:ABC transporter permease subunit [Desulforapulum autotrophicum]ACN15940.1 PstA3 [Desulforapulum autotrophicum HRM2]
MNKRGEQAVYTLSVLSCILLFGSLALLLSYLVFKGFNALNLSLIFGSTPMVDALLLKRQVFDGIFPAMAGTLALIVLAIGAAVPVGLLAGIYMAEYSNAFTRSIFGFLFDLLSAIPSIVVGLFGFSVILFLHHHVSQTLVPSLVVAALSLAFLVLPYIVRTTQIALETVPQSVRLTGIALGATRLQNIIHCLLPQSLSTLLGGIILAVGRCAEDTAVIMLTGAVASAGVPDSLFKGFEALPFFIYYTSSQYTSETELAQGFGACIVLLIICATLFILASMIQKKARHILLYTH